MITPLASAIHVILCVPLVPSPITHRPHGYFLLVVHQHAYFCTFTPPLALLAWSEWCHMYSPVRRTLSPDFSSTSCCREQNVKKCIVRCSFVERRIVATSSQSFWRAEWQVASVWFTVERNTEWTDNVVEAVPPTTATVPLLLLASRRPPLLIRCILVSFYRVLFLTLFLPSYLCDLNSLKTLDI